MRRQGGLIKGLLPIILFVVLEGASIVLITNNSVIQRYQVMRFAQNIQSFFWSKSSNITDYFSLKEKNEVLALENEALKQQLATIVPVNNNISDSNDVVVEPIYSLIPAKVIKNTVNKQHNYIIINKGAEDGIAEGMGVINSSGIVGIVNSVSDHYAYVLSFLNTTQNVSAKIAKNNVFGPMKWTGRSIDKALLSEIPLHCDVQTGDTISTSGFSIIYPADIPLGVVMETKVIDGVSQEVEVSLFQNFKSLYYVEVVFSNRKSEILTLETNE